MKLKNILHNRIFPAALITLLGTAIRLLACTIMGARGIIKGFLPLWLFLIFAGLDIVLNIVPHTSQWKWFKPVVFAAAAFFILLFLAIFRG